MLLYNRDTYFYPFFMKDSCCSNKSGLCSWFCPNFIGIVVGIIMVSAGIGKFMGGAASMWWVGGAALGVFGIDSTVGSMLTLATILGYIAATIEVVWGLAFGLGCRKTSKYAAPALSLLMIIVLLVHFKTLKPVDGTGFNLYKGILWQVQLPLLLLAIFAQKTVRAFSCCNTSCCVSPEMANKA